MEIALIAAVEVVTGRAWCTGAILKAAAGRAGADDRVLDDGVGASEISIASGGARRAGGRVAGQGRVRERDHGAVGSEGQAAGLDDPTGSRPCDVVGEGDVCRRHRGRVCENDPPATGDDTAAAAAAARRGIGDVVVEGAGDKARWASGIDLEPAAVADPA